MNTKEFIQYANERPELCEKLAVCTTPEEVYEIASAEGLTDSLEEFKSTMIEIKNSAELSESDLEGVSAAGAATGTFCLSILTLVSMAGIAI